MSLRRHSFIPPRQRVRVPNTRPVSVLDVDPSGDGWWYRCSLFGVPVQVFSQKGATPLSAGDRIIARHVPTAGLLWFPSPEKVGEPELYFGIGNDYNSQDSYDELWVLTPASDTPVYVWTVPNNYEAITNIAWSTTDGNLYVFTYLQAAADIITAYRVDRVNKTVAAVATLTEITAGTGIGPVCDVAQWHNKLYLNLLHMAGTTKSGVAVFDPIAETIAFEFQFPSDEAGGGIATNEGNGTIYASNGTVVYKNDGGGGGWVLDTDITTFNAWDNMAMITDWENDKCYHAMIDQADVASDPQVIERDNTADTWAASLVDGNMVSGSIALAHGYSETTGALQELWVLGWGVSAGDPARIWRKSPGNAWVLDGNMPEYHMGLTTQGICWFNGKLHIITWDMGAGTQYNLRLYRRDGAGTYNLLHDFGQRYFSYNPRWALTGMAKAASPAAGAAELALMKMCHLVN
jgi:hypothetical protein